LDYSKELINVQLLPSPGREEAEAAAGLTLSLGNTTKLPSLLLDDQLNRRVSRYLIQSIIAEILPNERVARCLHLVVPSASGVKVMYSDKVKRAHYKGLTVCGSIWSCPVCAAKISERRRLELRPALENWPGGLIMASYTLQHSLNDNLHELKSLLYKCYDRLMSGKGWQDIKKRWGIVGLISSSELTWGSSFGWHPHKHALIFTKEKLSNSDLKHSEDQISARFRGLLAKNGRYGHPQFSVNFRVGNIFEESEYVFKWGIDYELTKSNVKKARAGNYSPFELAQWAGSTGELQPVQLFREYFGAYKGSHQLQYTNGLRSLLALNQEKTDYQLAIEEDQQAFELALIARSAWAIVCKKKKRGDLLEVASTGSIDLLVEFLKSIGAI
jgi:hypothetical protein